MLVISDRGVDADWAPIPSLLATAAVHHHLVREGLRTEVGIIVETGEARDVTHFALLIGYGAGTINPYLALESLVGLVRSGNLPPSVDEPTAETKYIKAAEKGLLKVISKMGISTIQSVLRRAGLRGDRPRSAARRALLHRHRVAHRRHRDRAGCRGDAPPSPHSLRRRAAAGPARLRQQLPLPEPGRAPQLESRSRSPRCSRRRAPTTPKTYEEFSRLVNDEQRASLDAARAARVR